MNRVPALSRAVAGSIAAALALGSALPAAAQSDVETTAEAAPETKGEKRLAKLLEGRVAGEPQRCIRTMPNQRLQTIDRTAYVYGSGSTIYVQRTRDPGSIDDSDALVSRRFIASELCKLDMMTTVDPVTGIFTGAVFFEDFVPYTRVKDGTSSDG
ncbi:hypothetical protein [Porphyrobacter sp. AAP60]|uniref:hypothetical protein n=1 Tax=Porphyrobacter sp. AAP60 TaxID=1523423 RepID=UPI0006B89BE1|nr:hypothetical protein [Porphyrobacter sp. AAP60]KPF63957.1 hypothetical protein IP79_09180 [Porphyrobacter sp. AAP60]